MFNLRFENQQGAVYMGGASHPKWRVYTLEGTGIPPVKRTAVSYAGLPGQTLLSRKPEARTLTLSGELVNYGQAAMELTWANKVFQQPGTLYLESQGKRRKIACEATEFRVKERTEAYVEWVLQLVCDDPYFQDFQDTVVQVFQRENLIKGSFTLPMVFSKRTMTVQVEILGDRKIEPVFEIHGGDIRAGSYRGEIRILNKTTGQRLTIQRTLEKDEVLTVDIPNREIRSSKEDGVLYCMSQDTYLSRFWLERGVNEILLENDTDRELNASCVYHSCYGEAVV